MSPSPDALEDAIAPASRGRIVPTIIAAWTIVGVLLSFVGITPRNFFRVLDDFARHIYDLGFGAVEWLFDYLVLGAMLVVPIWLLIRLLRARPKDDA